MDVAEGFSEVKLIASGGYGRVFSAREECWEKKRRTSRYVVIKTMGHLHHGYLRMSAFRELFILNRLQTSPFVVALHSSYAFFDQESGDVDALQIVLEKLDMDVAQLLRLAKRGLSGLGVRWTEDDWSQNGRVVVHRVLCGLQQIHSINAVHRDIKPGNVLVNVDSAGRPVTVKIADFGLARPIDASYSHDGYLTHAVSTRWYRAPELLLGHSVYSNTIDTWSVGCILAEFLLHGLVLFPGANDTDQLHRILDVLGREVENASEELPVDDEVDVRRHCDGCGLREGLSPHITAQEMALLESLLTFDGKKRPSAKEALENCFFNTCSVETSNLPVLHPMHIEDESLCLLAKSPGGFVDALCMQEVQFRRASSPDRLKSAVESLSSLEGDLEKAEPVTPGTDDSTGPAFPFFHRHRPKT